MFAMFKKKEVLSAGLIITNIISAALALHKTMEEPDKAAEFLLDMSIHIVTAFLLDNKASSSALHIGILANAYRTGVIFGSMLNGTSSLGFAAGIMDSLFHFANTSVLIDEDRYNIH